MGSFPGDTGCHHGTNSWATSQVWVAGIGTTMPKITFLVAEVRVYEEHLSSEKYTVTVIKQITWKRKVYRYKPSHTIEQKNIFSVKTPLCFGVKWLIRQSSDWCSWEFFVGHANIDTNPGILNVSRNPAMFSPLTSWPRIKVSISIDPFRLKSLFKVVQNGVFMDIDNCYAYHAQTQWKNWLIFIV